jgi:FkbM family methyltransferase
LKKLLALKRLSLPLALRVIYIYGLKAAGIQAKGENLVILNYFNLLIRADLYHAGRTGDCFKIRTHDGVYLYKRAYPSSDSQVVYQIWKDEEYAVVVEQVKKSMQGKTLRIVDAGANVGYASVYLYQKLRERFDIEIIVIEPGDDNVKMIEQNFKENKIINYHIEKAGLFNKPAYLALNRDFRDGKDWSLSVQEVDHPTDLKGIELVELLKKYQWDHVDFCKIDIEGSEQYLFNDAAYAAKMLEKVKMLSVEIHEEFIAPAVVEQRLTENSFSYFKHGEITIGFK